MKHSDRIIKELKKLRNQKNIEGMARFGINSESALGISVTKLRQIAKGIDKDHHLALELWDSAIHEARILATMIDDHKLVSKTQMNKWVNDVNSWDLCDQCCNNLFRKTHYAIDYSFKWADAEQEFIKRAGFVLMAF